MKRVFLTSTPSHRNAYDLFDGCWASDLSERVPDLIRVLGHHGLTETTIIADGPSFMNGSAVTLAAQRPGAASPA
jgi:hypothetical protein